MKGMIKMVIIMLLLIFLIASLPGWIIFSFLQYRHIKKRYLQNRKTRPVWFIIGPLANIFITIFNLTFYLYSVGQLHSETSGWYYVFYILIFLVPLTVIHVVLMLGVTHVAKNKYGKDNHK